MTKAKDINLKPKLHPLLASLPKHLKNPANYDKIQKTIIDSLQGKCSHAEVVDWGKCTDCQARFENKQELLKKLGFTHPAQYMMWKKTHEGIKARFPLTDWKKVGAVVN